MIYKYGTAGFRYQAVLLPKVVQRLGSAMAMIVNMYSPEAYGVMFTASHNPAADNGVKIVYRNGISLPQPHIDFLEHFVNMPEEECEQILSSPGFLESILTNDSDKYSCSADFNVLKEYINASVSAGYEVVSPPKKESVHRRNIVILARDTRDSGEALEKLFEYGFQRVSKDIEILKAGFMPTATHHYYVANFFEHENPLAELLNYGFESSKELIVHVDCTNGVGALWVEKYFNGCKNVTVQLYNDDYKNTQLLNFKSGADYVQSLRVIPDGVPYDTLPPFTRIYHLDGDCDRMVLSFFDENKEFHIFDGDHLLLLFISFIQKAIPHITEFCIGAVHTSYANSGLTNALRTISTTYHSVVGVKTGTGVAKLIQGSEAADIAVYFEPNGHGSMLIHHFVKEAVMKTPIAPLFQLTNSAIGDGIANIRAVEYMLDQLGWSTKDWLANTFKRCPTKLVKIPVSNPLNYASNASNEEILKDPQYLQKFLEDTLSNFSATFGDCHAFLRPSGTEPYMRLKVDMEKDDPIALELLTKTIQSGVELHENVLKELLQKH